MKRAMLIIVLILTMLGTYAQQKSQKSINHFLIGINANMATFNNRNRTTPFSYGISPFAMYLHNRLGYSIAVGWSAFDDQWKTAPKCTRYYHWNEVNLSFIVNYRVNSEHPKISFSVFCGPAFDFLTHYRIKVVSEDNTFNLNTEDAVANYSFCGIDVMAGITMSYDITNRIRIGLSPYFKYKILNEIRDDDSPRLPLIVHPDKFYGMSFSFCYQIK